MIKTCFNEPRIYDARLLRISGCSDDSCKLLANIIPLLLRDYVVYETINLIPSWYIDVFLLTACVLLRSSKTWKVKIEFEESMKKFGFQFYSHRNL